MRERRSPPPLHSHMTSFDLFLAKSNLAGRPSSLGLYRCKSIEPDEGAPMRRTWGLAKIPRRANVEKAKGRLAYAILRRQIEEASRNQRG